jgi:S1-C subfamily serine protease
MPRISVPTIILALPPLLLGSCAGLLNKGNQSLQVNSDPTGATVLVNGTEAGVTPFTYTLGTASASELNMEVRMEGHVPTTFAVAPQLAKGVLFADAMLLGIPYLADAQSPALRKFGVKQVDVHLYKAYPKDLQHLELPVADLVNAIPGNAPMGRSGGSKLTMDSRELNDLAYQGNGLHAVLQGLKGAYVDAFPARPGTEEGDRGIHRAKILLRPVVKGVEMQLEKKRSHVDGTIHLDMDWRFLSATDPDSTLFTISTATDHVVYGAYAREAVGVALADAARRLLDQDGLYDRIATVHARGLVSSKGSALQLTKPRPVAFADRRSMFPELVKAVVTVETADGHGSGFLVTNDGYILSNAHVVDLAANVKVRFQQGFALEGQVVKVNPDFDLALIKVPGSDLPALELGHDSTLVLGEELFAIGTPLDERLGQSLARGIMSGRREIDGRAYLQTDVSINPGNSGGPLVDDQGRVVGIATMKVSATGVEGIGFGVPISTALLMLNIDLRP